PAAPRSATPAIRRIGRHSAVLPPGTRIFVSGQADPGANLSDATRRTLEGLAATLRHLGLDRSRVVQVKAFFQPIEGAADVEREPAAFFGGGAMPPLVLVEWRSSQPIEIELVASGRDADGDGAIAFLTPPELKPSPLFSRVVRTARSPL